MSDYFKLPIASADLLSSDALFPLMAPERCAITEAVNNHDRLTDERQQLIDALQQCVTHIRPTAGSWIDVHISLLNKLKEQ